MAYIDNAYSLQSAGYPATGGGSTPGGNPMSSVNTSGTINANTGGSGSAAVGAGLSVSSWVIALFVIVFVILLSAGAAFNKKG